MKNIFYTFVYSLKAITKTYGISFRPIITDFFNLNPDYRNTFLYSVNVRSLEFSKSKNIVMSVENPNFSKFSSWVYGK